VITAIDAEMVQNHVGPHSPPGDESGGPSKRRPIMQFTRWSRWLPLVVVLVLGAAAGARVQAASMPEIGIRAPEGLPAGQDAIFLATVDLGAMPEDEKAALDQFEFTWRFSDGVSATGIALMRSFAVPGVYTVTLVVKGDDGAIASLSRTVIVTEPPAPAAPTEVMIPENVSVSDLPAPEVALTVKDAVSDATLPASPQPSVNGH
jgi:PKD domain